MISKTKACFAQSSLIKNSFKGAICALPISVGQQYHEGHKILATIKLLNKYFAKCVVIVCDSLQRHSTKLYCNENEATAYEKALTDGLCWLERNADVFKHFEIPYEVVHWDKWYKSREFPAYLKKIEQLENTDIDFATTLNNCADTFISRHILQCGDGKKYTQETCKNYLKEEGAVLLMWYCDEGYDFLAYPGSNNNVIAGIYNYFIKPNNEKNKLVFLKIKFK